MELRHRQLGDDLWLVGIQGRLDAATAPDVDECFWDVIEDGAKSIVLDVTRLDYLSSAGLRVIISAAKQTRGQGGRLVLHSPTSCVQEILDISGLSTILEIHPSREAAVASFIEE